MAAALLQNAVTMSASMSTGDFISQRVVAHFQRSKRKDANLPEQSDSNTWDSNRTVKMGAVGLFVQGPIFHAMYLAADKLCGTKPAFSTVLRKVAFTSAVAPIHISTFFTATVLLSGGDLAMAKEKVMNDVPVCYLAGMAYWPAFNIANFHFISAPATRVKAAAFAGMIWNIFLTYRANTGP